MAGTIDEVIDELTEAVDWSRESRSRLGFFAALYRRVTIQVRDDIAAGKFADGGRMEQLDVVFANRYLDALRLHRDGDSPTESWRVAFAAAEAWRPLIVQQLLVGINAHINLDLGIAAAEVGGGDVAALEGDFMAINGVLAAMVEGVLQDMGRLSPWIWLLDKVGGRTERKIINFSLEVARGEAWSFANQLSSSGERATAIAAKDARVGDLGWFVVHPGPKLTAAAFIIKAREKKNVPEIIDELAT